MKKLSLKSLLEFGTSMPVTPGLRPEGPSGKNQHQFPHHGLYSRYGGGKPKTPDTFPYPDSKSDLATGDFSAELSDDTEDLPSTEDFPDTKDLPLEEFFKFTKSANDNTSFYRPPTYGSGAPKAYGKSATEFGSFDPSVDEDDPKDAERKETIKGRASQKVGVFEAFLQEDPGMRERHPRDDNDYSTKQPWANGLPGYDKKDITNGDARIDELMKELEREEENGGKSSIEEALNELNYGAPGSVGKRGWATTSDSEQLPRIARQAKSDMNFWDIIARDNVYMMTGLDEFEDEQKEKSEKSKESKKS